MKNIPEKIYLQIGEGNEDEPDFSKFTDVTWCVDKVFNNDLEFVLNKPDVLNCKGALEQLLIEKQKEHDKKEGGIKELSYSEIGAIEYVIKLLEECSLKLF